MNPIASFILLASVSAAISVQGGVYVSKDLETGIGVLTESEKIVNFSSPQIIASFPKTNILWYDTDPSINTFLKAAERAESQNQSIPIIRKLYETSIRNELLTAIAARKSLTSFEQKIKAQVEAKQNSPTESSMVPEIIVRSPSPNEYATVNINYESSDFKGFIRYPTYAVVNGKAYTFYTPQPIFSKTQINTTVNVSTSPAGR
jgi:hypothetical protein